MTSGQNHDKATTLLSIPFGLLIGVLFEIKYGAIAWVSFLIGGLWLSPDLDIHSSSLKRWGIFQIIWLPYRKLITHRSILSHGPFIGSTLRILYLSIIGLCLKFALNLLNIDVIFFSSIEMKSLISNYPKELLTVMLGIEASVWLHLILDGDPLTIQFKKLKN